MTHCLREGGDPQRRARRRAFPIQRRRASDMGPVIKLMDNPLRLGAGRQPVKDGFSTRSGLCRLSRNKKMSGYPRDRVASCALARCPVSAPRRCHEVVPWQTVAVFDRPLWRNMAVRSGSRPCENSFFALNAGSPLRRIKSDKSSLRKLSLASAAKPLGALASRYLHRLHRSCNTEYVHDPLQVVGQYLKTHLGTHPRERAGRGYMG